MPLADHVTERAQARVGAVLRARWRLDRVIGVGGMATVYAATHRNQSRVAIKVLHPEVALDSEVTMRFLREGYVANVVEHSGTVKVLDDDVDDEGCPFLVMELLEGETVDARWTRKGQRLEVGEVLAIGSQILEVLAVAHDQGVIHRDLKPENLFLTRDGELKILDFGIARLREYTPDGNSTRVGSLLGTPAFMAPEQARGRWDEVDWRTDIWAIGATLFTLLSGRFVHEAETVQEQLIHSATVPAQSVGEIVAHLPPAVIELVDRALAFDRNERWADARAMLAALRAAAGLESSDGPLTLPAPSTPSVTDAATLIAPAELSSVITGKTYTTARPVTNPISQAESPKRSVTLPLTLALAASAAAAIFAGWYALATPHASGAMLERALPAAQPPRALLPARAPLGLTPDVTPTTDPTPPGPVPIAAKPAPHPMTAAKHSPTKPTAKPETTQGTALVPTKPPPTHNPFDRRL
jgi:eukaryotic-like serine/threonine-protein kinase